MSGQKLSLKLLVDSSTNRVIYAEAGKDFIDFLFSFLSLSVGSAIKLLRNNDNRFEGSIATLFNSVQNLNQTYIRTGLDKSALLNLITPSLFHLQTPSPFLLLKDKTHKTAPPPAASSTKYYICGRNHNVNYYAQVGRFYVSNVQGATCPHCKASMNEEASYVAGAVVKVGEEEGGYVKGVVTYMVMDNLEVSPLSTISCLSLLGMFNVKDVTALQEKVVEVGKEEGVALLKASLQSKTALTDVFLSSNEQSGQRSSCRRLQ